MPQFGTSRYLPARCAMASCKIVPKSTPDSSSKRGSLQPNTKGVRSTSRVTLREPSGDTGVVTQAQEGITWTRNYKTNKTYNIIETNICYNNKS